MILKDRKRLAKLMVIQDVTHRQLAAQIGWKAHSQVARLLNGQEQSVVDEKAVAMASFLGVDVSDLFLPSMTTRTSRRVHDRSAA
jgi:transcriptional regulator with XRE-family HTH domain